MKIKTISKYLGVTALMLGLSWVLLGAGAPQSQFSGGGGGGGGLPSGLTFASPTFTVSSAGNGNGSIVLSGNTSSGCSWTTNATGTLDTSSCVIGVPNGTIGALAYQYAMPNYGSFFDTSNAGIGWGTGSASNTGVEMSGTGGFTSMYLGSAFAFGISSATSASGAGPDTRLSRASAGVWSVDTSTTGNALGTIKPGLYASGTNCAAVGTAANPSVASCTAAAAGSFSCATNASTGTCQVNTTAVTANSEILIEGRNDTTTGTRLGVTCNTGITTALPEIAAVTAGTSFTINLGTFTTNPECFSYMIIN